MTFDFRTKMIEYLVSLEVGNDSELYTIQQEYESMIDEGLYNEFLSKSFNEGRKAAWCKC